MMGDVTKALKTLKPSELPISIEAFLLSYNLNIPLSWPRASLALLKRFKETNATLFTQTDVWSLDRHRKRLMDWLARQQEA